MRSMALAEGLYTWEGKELVLPEVYKYYSTVPCRGVASACRTLGDWPLTSRRGAAGN
jgi:hypothetical protein